MPNFAISVTGTYLITQVIDNLPVVNSCSRYEDAVARAEELSNQSPDNTVWLYKIEEIFTTSRTPVERRKMNP